MEKEIKPADVAPNVREPMVYPDEYAQLKEQKDVLQRIVGIKEAALQNLREERDRLRRVIELKENRVEQLADTITSLRADRDKLREELGNLLGAIDQWKIKSGLY